MNPAERVRIITETARAVLDGRLDAVAGATTLTLQEEQIAPHLRSDRIDVTQAEADITGDTTLVYEGGVLSPGSLTVEVNQMFGIHLGADDSLTAVLIGCSGGQTLVPGTTVGYLITEPGTYELVDDLTSEVIGTVTAE